MKNIIIDVNILLDYYEEERSETFPKSVKAFEYLKNKDFAFVSSSSLDNFAYLKSMYLKRDYPNMSKKERLYITSNIIKEFLTYFKIAKTPSYISIDYDDIEDSQVLSSAIATNAKVVTRDEKMLKKYPDLAISPNEFLEQKANEKLNIDFANLKKQHFLYQEEIEKQLDEVMNNANFILGSKVDSLEEALRNYTKANHAITCSSGTDALVLALMALDVKSGDEVITTPFTFIATAESIALVGAKPVFVDIDEKTYNIDANKIEEKITPNTKAVIAVSLYGQPPKIDEIQKITKKHNLKLIIDGAQSFGATYNGQSDSNLGDISCTSFFPAKPLGCYGDGGAVFTNDEDLALKIKQLRVHGQDKRYHHKYIGVGARMDAMQAAVLLVKLKYYAQDLALRQEVAQKYNKALQNKDLILPFVENACTSAWAQYSVRVKDRQKTQASLQEKSIPTAVHYPLSLHEQECFKDLGYKTGDFPISEKISKQILSLPMNPYLSDEEIEFIAKAFG